VKAASIQMMRGLPARLKTLSASAFMRNVAMIASGAALAQALLLLVSPLLTRLFSPEAFGLLGMFMAVAGIIGPSAALRYELAIPVARTELMAGTLLYLCLIVAAALSALSGVIVILWAEDIGALLDAPALAPYLYLLPIHIFAMGAFLALSQWAARREHFAVLARNPMTRSVAAIAVQLGAGIAALGQGWLIIGFLAGHVAAALGLFARLMRREAEALRPPRRLRASLVAAARRFRRFPVFAAPQELLNALSQQLPNLVLAAFFGPVVLGLYWLTMRVLQAPAQLIGQSVRQVFYQRICDLLNRGGSSFSLMAKTTGALALVGALAFVPVIAFGPMLFALIFGEEWREAGEYARWVALWSWVGFANVPAVCGLQAMGAQKGLLVYEIFLFIGRNGALFWFAFAGEPLEAVIAYALVGAAFNLALIFYGHGYALTKRQISST